MAGFLELIHTAQPLTNTAFDTWVDFCAATGVPAMEQRGFDLVGAWKRTGGCMLQDVHLFRWQDRTALDQAAWSPSNGPTVLEALGKTSAPVDVVETVKIAETVPYAQPARLERALREKPDQPRQYMQMVLELVPHGQAAAYALIAKLVDTLAASGGLQLVTAYETTIGQRGELTDIWIAPPGVRPLAYHRGDPLGEIVGPLREVAPQEAFYYLNPLPHSPLQ